MQRAWYERRRLLTVRAPWRWCRFWNARCGPRVVLIRHADYVPSTNGDPGLSPAGQARAQTLVHVLGGTGIDHIIVSQWARTQQTAAPLETHLGIGYQVIEALHRAAILTAIRA
jgi:phosphohistidine phosphatase SixA